ncbi:MAG: histidinol dehydrogenase [Candidatus Omnitrophica bacterium]|nr:histidinol dehydrogenase [Candidatus Omnitrophota bacterium]
MKLVKIGSTNFKKLVNRNSHFKKRVSESVKKILDNVRLHGDDAVIKYTRKFDGVRLRTKDLKVSETETSAAYQNIKPEIVNTLKAAMENINKFYRKQLKKSWRTRDKDGVILGEKITPLENVGVYVPSGTVPLVSSVYMTVLPARIAGVGRIALASPPNKYGTIDPYILVVADLLKVDEIYKVGGAQAIGALAFGTKTIPKVDKVVGPGNIYVTEAKRQVFGYCDIDMLAGPSEVVIIADRYADIKYLKADLAAQAEHAKGVAILVTPSKSIVKAIKKEINEGFIVLTKSLKEAVEVTNLLAPEHLQLMIKNPRNAMREIKNAGAIFIGPYTPVVVGDYVAGPSHVLPTGGTARFFSGLGTNDFVKSSHVMSYTKKALDEIKDAIAKLTTIEGLPKHMESVWKRFE